VRTLTFGARRSRRASAGKRRVVATPSSCGMRTSMRTTSARVTAAVAQGCGGGDASTGGVGVGTGAGGVGGGGGGGGAVAAAASTIPAP
jgi:hypothetical protein